MHRSSFAIAIGATFSLCFVNDLNAGIYTEPGIAATDASIVAWAAGVSVVRGPQDLSNPASLLASAGVDANATDAANGTTVSLGDGGSATVTFAKPIANGSGADFAVFENAFVAGSGPNIFGELAFVEVSSDGTTFFRFPSISLTQTDTQVPTFGTLNGTEIHNLAGKHSNGLGTSFDLSDLSSSPLLNVDAITSVRVIDVVGSLDVAFKTVDSEGHKINDPFKTPFPTGGFDLDAVGVIHVAPEPIALGLVPAACMLIARRRRS